jgi:hypothetical protein
MRDVAERDAFGFSKFFGRTWSMPSGELVFSNTRFAALLTWHPCRRYQRRKPIDSDHGGAPVETAKWATSAAGRRYMRMTMSGIHRASSMPLCKFEADEGLRSGSRRRADGGEYGLLTAPELDTSGVGHEVLVAIALSAARQPW